MNISFLPAIGLIFSVAVAAAAGEVSHFDTDPGWESFRSRLVPNPLPVVRQDFGYRTTNRAKGKQAGEIGGWVQRSLTPAWYAKVIPTTNLENRLTASGKIAVTNASGGSGALIGWFHDTSRGWRTPNSLAFRLDGNGGSYWLLYEYGTRHWLTGGEGTFEGRYQTTKTKPFAADGTVHEWTLTYDPAGHDGDGLVTFTFDGKPWHVPLASGHKADGAEFNRFGIFNQQTTGGDMEFYVDDLTVDGQALDIDDKAKWDARGNVAEFAERIVRPKHDFGFSGTQFAGGGKGEIGGTIFRDEAPAYYADKVGPLTLNDELFASGKLAFTGAGSDSAAYLGWFDSRSKQNKTVSDHVEPQKNILAICIEGPSQIGHYFRPGYSTAAGTGALMPDGPIIRPDGKVHHWSLHYDPAGTEGRGRITVKFDDHVQTLDLKPGDKSAGATFNRFGLFNLQSGGWHVQLYIDDLTYTKTKSPGADAGAGDKPRVGFAKQVLTDKYYCDGITSGDLNRDGKPDIVAGPFWYAGPDFKTVHEFYPAKEFPTEPSPTDSMFSYVHDFNADGWPDILVLGRVHLHEAFWYENPQGQTGRWKKRYAFHRVQGEAPPFTDADHDGRPELIAHWENRWGFIQPNWSDPASAWNFKPVTALGNFHHFYHGTGIGDVNGDGRPDFLLNEGWYEQPSNKSAEWIRHEFTFGGRGGAQMFSDDVDGDGDHDVITALDAHGWGLAWFEHVREAGGITFRKHVIMGSRDDEAKFGAAFSQPHALAMADIDGDGLKDIITGKRRWAHGPKGDIEPMAEPVVYWFQLVRENGQARYVPRLVDNQSGVGCQITATDLNGDGRPDIATASKLGAFVFLSTAPNQ